MIVITNGKERIEITRDKIKKNTKIKNGLKIIPQCDYWEIDITILKKGIGCYEKLIKTYKDDIEIIKEYTNMNPNLKNTILLKDDDFKEIKVLYERMQVDEEYEKNAIIESFATLFAFECFRNYELEQLENEKIEYLFKDLFSSITDYKRFKKEILARTEEILKNKYNVTNIKYIKFGGNKNE